MRAAFSQRAEWQHTHRAYFNNAGIMRHRANTQRRQNALFKVAQKTPWFNHHGRARRNRRQQRNHWMNGPWISAAPGAPRTFGQWLTSNWPSSAEEEEEEEKRANPNHISMYEEATAHDALHLQHSIRVARIGFLGGGGGEGARRRQKGRTEKNGRS